MEAITTYRRTVDKEVKLGLIKTGKEAKLESIKVGKVVRLE